MAALPWKSSMDAQQSPESPLGFALGKTFQKRSVSSPAPVTMVWRQDWVGGYRWAVMRLVGWR